MSLSVYLYFGGQCRDAFDHYVSIFDAEEICRQTFADGPADMFEGQPSDYIMHTSIKIGDTILMGSDRAAPCDTPTVMGNNFSISYRPLSKEDADEKFAKLSTGGQTTMALQETFWGSYFGLCTDKFGIHWMFNYPLDPNSNEIG